MNGLLHRVRNRHLAFAAALAAHEQPELAGVGARAAQVLGPQAAQLGGPQPAVTENTEQRVIALAGQRPTIGNA
ncbi:MAG: hypothetical protein M3Y17_06880 [Actinomycetota bacterium]|nr:hypothetical protein [Actinomycetota bacterium]